MVQGWAEGEDNDATADGGGCGGMMEGGSIVVKAEGRGGGGDVAFAAIGVEGSKEVDEDGDANADGGGCEGFETAGEKDGEFKLLIHPRIGWIVDSDDDGIAADDDGGGGCATAERLMLFFFAFFAGLVAAAEVLVVAAEVLIASKAAASFLRASLASLYFFLQQKHVRRGFIVPFLTCSHKYLSVPLETRSSFWQPRHRIIGGTYADGDGGVTVETAAIE